MLKTKKFEELPHGDFLREAAAGIKQLIDGLAEKYPGSEAKLAGIVSAFGNSGVITTMQVNNEAEAMAALADTKTALRIGAWQLGEKLHDKPLDREDYEVERQQILAGAQDIFSTTRAAAKCKCRTCEVTAAATLVAAAIKMLEDVGVPGNTLADLLMIGKEACRVGHLKALEHKAIGSA
jgi:hypothetical protein